MNWNVWIMKGSTSLRPERSAAILNPCAILEEITLLLIHIILLFSHIEHSNIKPKVLPVWGLHNKYPLVWDFWAISKCIIYPMKTYKSKMNSYINIEFWFPTHTHTLWYEGLNMQSLLLVNCFKKIFYDSTLKYKLPKSASK